MSTTKTIHVPIKKIIIIKFLLKRLPPTFIFKKYIYKKKKIFKKKLHILCIGNSMTYDM